MSIGGVKRGAHPTPAQIMPLYSASVIGDGGGARGAGPRILGWGEQVGAEPLVDRLTPWTGGPPQGRQAAWGGEPLKRQLVSEQTICGNRPSVGPRPLSLHPLRLPLRPLALAFTLSSVPRCPTQH